MEKLSRTCKIIILNRKFNVFVLTGAIHHIIVVIYHCYTNPFGADIPLTEKPCGWFAPAETENFSRRVTF